MIRRHPTESVTSDDHSQLYKIMDQVTRCKSSPVVSGADRWGYPPPSKGTEDRERSPSVIHVSLAYGTIRRNYALFWVRPVSTTPSERGVASGERGGR